jgi:hypothetical protein
MNRGLTVKTDQCPVQSYLPELTARIEDYARFCFPAAL